MPKNRTSLAIGVDRTVLKESCLSRRKKNPNNLPTGLEVWGRSKDPPLGYGRVAQIQRARLA
jgi:hypothetical protein